MFSFFITSKSSAVLRKPVLLLLLLCLYPVLGHGQRNIAVGMGGTARQPAVWLKCIDEQVVLPEGLVLYRSTNRQTWERLTPKPLKQGAYTPTQAELQADTLLQNYINLATSLAGANQGATRLVLLLKALQSVPYARYLGIMYIDTAVQLGQQYYYKACRIHKGVEQLLDTTSAITVAPYQPVAAPDSLHVVSKDGQVSVTWQPNPLRFWGVNIYRSSLIDTVYRMVNSLPLVASTRVGPDGKEGYATEFYTDTTARNTMVYRYRIEGLDFFGRPTLPTPPIEARPLDKTPPLFPYSVEGKVDQLQVALQWDNSLQSDDMWGYYVYRGTSYYKPFERISPLLPPAAASYTDTVPGPAGYYYYVAAVDFAQNEGKSPKISVDVPDMFPPAKPVVLSVQADSGQIRLQWQANTEPDLAGYQLYRASDQAHSTAYVRIHRHPLTDTVYVDKLPFVAKNTFYYQLYAIDHAYNRSEPADVVFGRMPDVVAPQQPFIKQVSQQDNGLLVEWVPNSDLDLMGYHLYRVEADKDTSTAQRLNAGLLAPDVTRFTDRFAQPNLAYKYYMVAVDSTNNRSVASLYYGAMLVQEQPQGVSVVRLQAQYRKRQRQVRLQWKIEPTDNPAYQGCVVYRQNTAGVFVPISALSQEHDYRDKDIEPGQSYHYQVRAYTRDATPTRSTSYTVKVE